MQKMLHQIDVEKDPFTEWPWTRRWRAGLFNLRWKLSGFCCFVHVHKDYEMAAHINLGSQISSSKEMHLQIQNLPVSGTSCICNVSPRL